ncbi:LIM and SH3 domain protein F42H10.3-like isoform X2 [Tubulanus polymorphus]|uniref:LIM and SH3 domain protein F42H10.3-like isoform X2 n=1 Tax=Tubulanus polymorphus TaxID=672921 RepID=UPI003DA234A3
MSSGVKKCSKCDKSVYPMELLKCLDQFWHKTCFKCAVCDMTLNMKNYKGYEKRPYCQVHYPTTKFTSVADTPENKRIAENTRNQSQVTYHKAFEDARGQYTPVAADVEMTRLLQNQERVSLVQYHAQFEKQKGQKISVESDPELQRSKKNMETISQVNYQGWKDKKDHMEKRRPSDAEYTPGISAHPNFGRQDPVVMASITRQDFHQTDNYPTEMKPGSIFDRDPLAAELGKSDINYNSPYKARSHSQVIYSGSARRDDNDDQRPRSGSYGQDPMNGQYTANQRSSGGDFKVPYGVPPQARPTKEEEVAPYVAALDPVTPEPITEPVFTPPEPIVEPQVEDAPPPSTLVQPPPAFSSQPRYIAMYDYSAADVDEVSFVEGDIIIDHESIDEGWMMGTVQRTGIRGMLPANYVELQA